MLGKYYNLDSFLLIANKLTLNILAYRFFFKSATIKYLHTINYVYLVK